MNDIEKLARAIFAWQSHTGPMGVTWESVRQEIRDKYLIAASLPNEERLLHPEFMTFEEMNPKKRGSA